MPTATKGKSMKGKMDATPVSLLPVEEETTEGLVRRAEAKDEDALAELRSRIRQFADFEAPLVNIGVKAERVLLLHQSKVEGKPNLYRYEVMSEGLQRMKAELAGPNPTPLVKALADRAALCWLQVNQATAYQAICSSQSVREQEEFYNRQQERAHQMYLSSLKALAQVRRLQLPSLMVNIAEKQINVLTG